MTELEKIIVKNQRDIRQFAESGYLTDALYEALFGFYAASGEMPYGTMKARTGDPIQWISQKFATFLANAPQYIDTSSTISDELMQAIVAEVHRIAGEVTIIAQGNCDPDERIDNHSMKGRFIHIQRH